MSKVILIDPGHGYLREDYYDPGAEAKHWNMVFEEAKIVYSYALALKHVLAQAGFAVRLTRPNWKSPATLLERCRMLRAPEAMMLLSLHLNAHDTAQATGWEILYRYDPPSPQLALARSLYQALTPFYTARNVVWRGYKKGVWGVLCDRTKPACLIELGFITNERDLSVLWKSDPKQYREVRLEWADCVLRGVRAYLSQSEVK